MKRIAKLGISCWTPYSGNKYDANYFMFNIDDVILNHSCEYMRVEAPMKRFVQDQTMK